MTKSPLGFSLLSKLVKIASNCWKVKAVAFWSFDCVLFLVCWSTAKQKIASKSSPNLNFSEGLFKNIKLDFVAYFRLHSVMHHGFISIPKIWVFGKKSFKVKTSSPVEQPNDNIFLGWLEE